MPLFGWKRARPDAQPPARPPVDLPTLDEITRGLHHAASSTSSMLQQQYAQLLKQYFVVGPDDTLVAKVVGIAVGRNHRLDVPAIALVSPNAFTLERMKVRLALRFDGVEARRSEGLTDEDASSANFRVSMRPLPHGSDDVKDGRLVELEMEFRQNTPPEGIMRVLEHFTNAVVPVVTDHDLYEANPVVRFDATGEPTTDRPAQAPGARVPGVADTPPAGTA